MILAIQKTNGQWWTGECWGTSQARKEYRGITALPEEIEDLQLEINSWEDIFYCDKDNEIEARVYHKL